MACERKKSYSFTYRSSKIVTIGNDPPWFVYLMTHNERSSNFKCYTFIGISTNPFRKHLMHKLKALPHCKKTRPASSHWVLAEVIGPFKYYSHANMVKDIWMDITRGENGRHMKGIKIVSVINGHEDKEEKEEEEKEQRLTELRGLSEKMNFTNVVRCFSRTVSEDIPFSFLKNLPPSMCKPSGCEPITLKESLMYNSNSNLALLAVGNQKIQNENKNIQTNEETLIESPFENHDRNYDDKEREKNKYNIPTKSYEVSKGNTNLQNKKRKISDMIKTNDSSFRVIKQTIQQNKKRNIVEIDPYGRKIYPSPFE